MTPSNIPPPYLTCSVRKPVGAQKVECVSAKIGLLYYLLADMSQYKTSVDTGPIIGHLMSDSIIKS